MKTLVLYDGRHGFTEKCLGFLANELSDEVDLWPVRRRRGTPDWNSYRAVVFGGPVYFGRWSPPLVRFLNKNASVLADRHPLAAFVVSLSPRTAALKYFQQSLPAPLHGKPGLIACFGGSITWKALSWWERLVLKLVRGVETDVSNLDLGEIQTLATWLTAKSSQA
jgi:menaquinone-dependent protoporphyrinogen IX oxidase